MDVTSLLNSGAGLLVEQQDSINQAQSPSVPDRMARSTTPIGTPSPEKTPSRRNTDLRVRIKGRTPWDAGGYSLPLSLDTKSIQTSVKPSFYCGDSPIETTHCASPNSPRHKCSGSQSSLSSSSSSVNSVSHSRISSLSTVSEFQPLNSLLVDITAAEKMADSVTSCPSALLEVSPPSPVLEESSLRPSTNESNSSAGSDHGSSDTLQRSQSPSDAILITRFQGTGTRDSQDGTE